MAVGKGHVVLCVDDEAVGLKVRRILLERAGYKVLTASDGQAGIDVFRTHDVDAVVLDYSMPGMSGGEVARAMRQIKPDVPILLLSAYVGLHDEVRSIVDIYMTKGEGAPALLERLSNLLTNPSASEPLPGADNSQ
ncbi:MAG TPA: response regulator [Acidobacteriaceae bacterium]|nr:response regulator [Acidobacteriaceae bacterium]